MNPDEALAVPPSRLSPIQAAVWRHSVSKMLECDAVEVFVSFKKKTFLLTKGGYLEAWTKPDWTRGSTLRNISDSETTHEFREIPDDENKAEWFDGVGTRLFRAKPIHKARLSKDPCLAIELFELTGLSTTSDYCRASFSVAKEYSQCVVHIDLNSADPQSIHSFETSPKIPGRILTTPELDEDKKLIWDYGWRYFIEDSFFRSADYLIVLDENMTYVFSQDEELGGLPYFDRKETGAAFERQFEAAPTIFNPPIPDSTRHVLSLFEFEEERNLVLEQLLKESHSSFALLDMASVNPLQNLKEFPRWEDVFTQHELKAYMLERAPAALESQTIAVLDTKRIADVVSAGWDFYPWIESAVLTYETKIAEVVLTLRMSLSSDETEDTTTHLFELIKRLLELIWPKTWLGEALRGEVVGFEHGPIQSSKWNMGTDGKFLVFPKPDLPTLNRWIDPERVRFNVGVWEIGGLGGSGRNDEKPKDFEELFVNWNSLNLENFIDHRQFLKRLASQAEPEQTS